MDKEHRECRECKCIKPTTSFYDTRGYICHGCCLIDRYIRSHGRKHDPEDVRTLLTTKYKSRVDELKKKLTIYESRLKELQAE